MTVSYLPVCFYIEFASSVVADTHPLFVLRSMLGRNLRSMCCISHKSKCSGCMYNRSCGYAFLFETILAKGNNVLPGRDRGAHPFAFTHGEKPYSGKIAGYDFTLTLFGKAIEYLPYIYAAFVHSGRNGLFKSRTPFAVTRVVAADRDILLNEEHLDTTVLPIEWHFEANRRERRGEMIVELVSPLRFKVGGKYAEDFTAQGFMQCLLRRMRTICTLYGTAEERLQTPENSSLRIVDKMFRWTDNRHYSARQKNAMELGGVIGTFKLVGAFSALEQGLLEFAHICNAGKNTAFGLGQVNYSAEWDG